MLAIAYRNLIEGPTGSLDGLNRSQRDAFAHSERRSRRQVQRAAAESLLGDLLDLLAEGPLSPWQVIRNHDGKPTLVNSGGQSAIEVSLSHSGPIGLVGISDRGEIGVDLELKNPRRSISEIAAFAFGPQERRTVESAGLSAFYRIWTLREALAKACGIGFPMLTDGRDYFALAPKAGNWQSEIDGRHWLFSTGDLVGDYAFSIAVALRSPFDANCGADLTPRQVMRGVGCAIN
jgi:4'-phosphopantetheinyl transferase